MLLATLVQVTSDCVSLWSSSIERRMVDGITRVLSLYVTLEGVEDVRHAAHHGDGDDSNAD